MKSNSLEKELKQKESELLENQVQKTHSDLVESLATEKKLREEEAQSFSTRLAEKAKAGEDLSRKFDDERDEIKTLKRKHANNVKDLTRQLQQVKRKLENYETMSNSDKGTVSLGSHTSTNGSLNTVGIAQQTNTHVIQPSQAPSNMQKHSPKEPENQVITEQVMVDKQMLIERIVKLQRAIAQKNEKIKFMDDHISQLIDEIQKNKKILQSYILKEEAGTMTVNFLDKAKIHWDHNNFCSCSDHQRLDKFISDTGKQNLTKAGTPFGGDQTIREALLGKLRSKWGQHGLIKKKA